MPGFVFWSLMMPGFPCCLGVVAPKLLRTLSPTLRCEFAVRLGDLRKPALEAVTCEHRRRMRAVIWPRHRDDQSRRPRVGCSGRTVHIRCLASSGQQVRVAELRRRFVDGPVLTMPAGGRGTSDTTGSVGIPGVGTVFFRNFTLSAQWGRLNADGGVLRAADGVTLSVPITGPLEGTTLRGDGWSATLNSGWVVRPATRPGSFPIVRENYSPLPMLVVAEAHPRCPLATALAVA